MSRFDLPLEEFAAKTGLQLETVVRKVTLDLFRAVGIASPVDTGRFKGNWNVSYGDVDRTVDLSKFDKSGQNVLGAHIAEVLAKAEGFKVGGIVYMTNSLAYAQRLEFGYSGQAPQGMVRLAAQRYARYLDVQIAFAK